MKPEPGDVIEHVLRLFAEHGDSEYGGEAVSQLEHALQAANSAREAGAGAALITAALLHDVGHLLHNLPDDAPDRGVDDRHEELADRWLSRWFGPEVVEPVRLHVDAKRYLCAIEPAYLEGLSGPSARSLRLQGGPMSEEEVERFRSSPHFSGAVSLRRWDDEAKVPGMDVPGIHEYVPSMREALAPRANEPGGS